MPELFTIDELERHLREEVLAAGGAKKWAKKNSCPMDHALHMLSNGSAASLPRILDVMGMEKVTLYQAKPKVK